MSIEEIIERLRERIQGEDWFSYEVDQVEWTEPRYYHQNQRQGVILRNDTGKTWVIVVGSSSTMSAEEADAYFRSSADTVDTKVITPGPLLLSEIIYLPKREKNYWKPRYERWKR